MSFAVVAAVSGGVKAVGVIAKFFGGRAAKKKAQAEQKKALVEMEAKKKQYEALDTSNLAENMENKMEDLTINQKGMQIQSQKGEQSRANIMQQMGGAAGGSGIAALAQTMANQGQLAAQKSGEMIGNQEQANQKAAADAAAQIQKDKISGEEKSRDLQYGKTSKLMELAGGEAQAAGEAKAAAAQAKGQAVAGMGQSIMGAASDRKLKKNVTKIGESNSGLNIYSFEYKNPVFGEGLFQGVMSDEIPEEAIIPMNGYDAVNYNMLDVEFKQI